MKAKLENNQTLSLLYFLYMYLYYIILLCILDPLKYPFISVSNQSGPSKVSKESLIRLGTNKCTKYPIISVLDPSDSSKGLEK